MEPQQFFFLCAFVSGSALGSYLGGHFIAPHVPDQVSFKNEIAALFYSLYYLIFVKKVTCSILDALFFFQFSAVKGYFFRFIYNAWSEATSSCPQADVIVVVFQAGFFHAQSFVGGNR